MDVVAEENGHLDTLLERLSHAYNAAGAYFETDLLSPADCLELILRRVRGAEGGEEAWRRLDIAVVVAQAGVVELLELWLGEQSHRRA